MTCLLLLFTYFTAFFFAATCYRSSSEDGNPRNGGLLQRLVLGSQDQSSLLRKPRQNGFSDGNNPLSLWGNFQPSTGGFNWDSNQNNYNKAEVASDQNSIVFEDSDNAFARPNVPPTTRRPPSSTVAIPGMATTRSQCEDRCQATSQYDPVCGDNDVTYTNIYWLKCAQKCGRNVNVKHIGSCPRVP